MFTVIYRLRIKPDLEQQFIESWQIITEYYLNNFEGALGSRLHRGSDGLWYAYAQWQSEAHRLHAFKNRPDLPARAKFSESVIENLPEIRLEIISDLLKSRPGN